MKAIILLFFITLIFTKVANANFCECPSEFGQSKTPISTHLIDKDKSAIMICNSDQGAELSPTDRKTFPLSAGFFNVSICGTKELLIDFHDVYENCCHIIKEEKSLSIISILKTIPDEINSPRIRYKIFYPEVNNKPKISSELLNEDFITPEYLSMPLMGEIQTIEKNEVFIKALKGDEESIQTLFKIREKVDGASATELSGYLSTYKRFTKYATKTSILKKNGKSIQELIPQGWKILHSKSGDLNQDGIEDLVFAMQNTDKANIKNDDSRKPEHDLNPRILGIYFGEKSGLLTQILVSDDFIIKHNPNMDEPFDGFSISKKGILSINFHLWSSSGSWIASNHKYKFRFKNKQFELIGYDSYVSHRSTAETTDYSINFLSKKMSVSKGNFSNSNPKKVQWKSFKLDKPLTIKSLKEPFNLEFEGVYL